MKVIGYIFETYDDVLDNEKKQFDEFIVRVSETEMLVAFDLLQEDEQGLYDPLDNEADKARLLGKIVCGFYDEVVFFDQYTILDDLIRFASVIEEEDIQVPYTDIKIVLACREDVDSLFVLGAPNKDKNKHIRQKDFCYVSMSLQELLDQNEEMENN